MTTTPTEEEKNDSPAATAAVADDVADDVAGVDEDIFDIKECLDILRDDENDEKMKYEAVEKIKDHLDGLTPGDDRIMTYIEDHSLVRVVVEALEHYLDKFRSESDDGIYYHSVLHLYHVTFGMIGGFGMGEADSVTAAVAAAAVIKDGGLDVVLSFLNSPWKEDMCCTTTSYAAFIGLLTAFNRSKGHDSAPLVEKILPVVLDTVSRHGHDSSDEESTKNFTFACYVIKLCFDSGHAGQHARSMVQVSKENERYTGAAPVGCTR